MGSLQLLTGLVDWCNLYLCRLPAQLLTWQDCFLKIGCVSMVFLARSLVIVMSDFNLLFGKVCVSVLIHAWLCLQRTILKLMGLQNVTIGLLNKSYVAIVLHTRKIGVSI